MVRFGDGRHAEQGTQVSVWCPFGGGVLAIRGVVEGDYIGNYNVANCYWSREDAWMEFLGMQALSSESIVRVRSVHVKLFGETLTESQGMGVLLDYINNFVPNEL